MTDQDLIAEWIEWLRAVDRSPSTIRLRRSTAIAFAAVYDMQAATMHDIAAWLAVQPGGPARRHGHLAALRGFYRWAVASGRLDRSPAALVPSVHVPSPDRRPVPEHVLARALADAAPATRRALLLGAYAGLRRTEIVSVHETWITDGWLRVVGKGRRVRVIPLHPLLREDLADLRGWAFPSRVRGFDRVSGETLAAWIARALGRPWTAHSLRHRFATQAYRATRDIRAVQALLGHASPATTAIYVRADEDTLTATVQAVA